MGFVAEEVRQIMARLGLRTFDEMVGRTDLLRARADLEGRARTLDLGKLLHRPPVELAIRFESAHDHELELAMDTVLIEQARAALERGEPVELAMPIRNAHRSAGTMLSSRIARKHGLGGLPDGTIRIRFTGSAGRASARSSRAASTSRSREKPTTTWARGSAAVASSSSQRRDRTFLPRGT